MIIYLLFYLLPGADVIHTVDNHKENIDDDEDDNERIHQEELFLAELRQKNIL